MLPGLGSARGVGSGSVRVASTGGRDGGGAGISAGGRVGRAASASFRALLVVGERRAAGVVAGGAVSTVSPGGLAGMVADGDEAAEWFSPDGLAAGLVSGDGPSVTGGAVTAGLSTGDVTGAVGRIQLVATSPPTSSTAEIPPTIPSR